MRRWPAASISAGGVDGTSAWRSKTWGVGVGQCSTATGELAGASLYKLPILFAVFEAGLNMGEELPITRRRVGTIRNARAGRRRDAHVAEALERMVTISDNTAAVMLGSRAGSARVKR